MDKNIEQPIVKNEDEDKIPFLETNGGDVPQIGKITEVPVWQRDNEFILTGYRINYNTWPRIRASIFQIHNETMNIWSHLIGAIIFMVLTGVILRTTSLNQFLRDDKKVSSSKKHTNAEVPIWPLTIQLLTIAFCLSSSTSFHIGIPFSKEIRFMLQKVDHNGIAVFIFGTTNCFIQYLSPCSKL